MTLATIGGALAIGKADTIGSIEVGEQADIVVQHRPPPVRATQHRSRAAAHVGERWTIGVT